MLKILTIALSAILSFIILSSDPVYASAVNACTNIHPTNSIACNSEACISTTENTAAILKKLQPIQEADIRVNDEFERQLQIVQIDIGFALLQINKGRTTRHVNKELRDLYGSFQITDSNPSLQNAISLFQSLTYPYIIAINTALNLKKSYQTIELQNQAELDQAKNRTGIWSSLKQIYSDWMKKKLAAAIALNEENIQSLDQSAQLYMNALVQIANQQRTAFLTDLKNNKLIDDDIYNQEMSSGSLTNGYFSLIPFSNNVPVFIEMDLAGMRMLYDKSTEQTIH